MRRIFLHGCGRRERDGRDQIHRLDLRPSDLVLVRGRDESQPAPERGRRA